MTVNRHIDWRKNKAKCGHITGIKIKQFFPHRMITTDLFRRPKEKTTCNFPPCQFVAGDRKNNNSESETLAHFTAV